MTRSNGNEMSFSSDASSSSSSYFTAEEDSPSTSGRSSSHTTSLSTMLMGELECPICLTMMVGQFHQPLFCSNGHPCCTSCSSRVSSCPSCRSSGPWSRCLPMERVGSWLLDRQMVSEPSPPPPLPTTPVMVWGGLLHTVPRNNLRRQHQFGSGGGQGVLGGSDDDRFRLYNSETFHVNVRHLEVTSSPDSSPVAMTSTEASPPSPANSNSSTSPPDSSTPLTSRAPLWLGSSTPSSLTPTPRESPEEGT